MNFINPAVLLGLIAASLPVILHILNLRKLKTVEFSSLQFLKEMQKNKIRRVKLKQLLLLIIRTLLLIAIVFAFARPTIDSNITGLSSFSKTSNIILFDNSASMDYSDEKGNRLNQSKKNAIEIINNMKNGDEALVIPMANLTDNETKIFEFTRNMDITKENIGGLKTSYQPANIHKSLKIAEKLLEKSQNISKNIFIISDVQPNVFEITQTDSAKLVMKHTNIYLIPVGYNSNADNKNLAIDSLNIISQIFQIGKPTEIEAIVKNNSKNELKNAVIQMAFNSSSVAQRAFDINPQTNRSIAIGATPTAEGPVNAYVQLENDAFSQDNKRYFGFIIPAKPNVALFSSQSSQKDFINIALTTSAKESFAKVTHYTTTQLPSVDLSQFDIVIVGDGIYNNSDFDLIKQYIENGGSAMIFANSQIEGGATNNSFVSMMAKLNIEIKLMEFSKDKHSQFISTDKLHPLFAGVFKEINIQRATVESPKIYKAMPIINNTGQSIIDMQGGVFLNENIIKDGKLLYCAVPPNLEWSNFPATGIFPAIIARTAMYLAAGQQIAYNFEIGKEANIIIPKKLAPNSNFKIVDPAGNEFMRQAAVLPSGAVIQLRDLNTPGVYSIYNSNNVAVAVVAMNFVKSESDFTKYENEELLNKLRQRVDINENHNTKIVILEPDDKLARNIIEAHAGTELWKIFIIIAIILACAEMLVCHKKV